MGNQAVTTFEASSLLAIFHSPNKVLSWLIGEHCYCLIPLQIPCVILPTCQAMKKKLIVTGFVAHYTGGNSSWYCKTGQRPKADEVIGCSGKATAVVFDK